jgi:hypothetical protein
VGEGFLQRGGRLVWRKFVLDSVKVRFGRFEGCLA